MKCEVHLVGNEEDFGPKFDKLKPEDQDWLFVKKKPEGTKGKKHHLMDLEEVIRFLTMFNEIEKIYFEVR